MYLDLMSDILQMPEIPYDLYDSPQEILIIIPLGWVKKDSLRLNIQDYRLFIEWERTFPSLKENLVPVKEDCYWWGISLAIDLPSQVYFDQIHYYSKGKYSRLYSPRDSRLKNKQLCLFFVYKLKSSLKK